MSEVEIIMGLNKSGKTKFLNTYLEITCVKNERILVIVFGEGNTKISDSTKNILIKFRIFKSVFDIDVKRILYLINVYRPHRILIEGEYLNIKKIYEIISGDFLKDILVVTSVIHVINSKFLSKIVNYNLNKISGNIVIINNFDRIHLDDKYLKQMRLKNLNSFLFYIEDFGEIFFKFKEYGLIKSNFHKNIFKCLKEYI